MVQEVRDDVLNSLNAECTVDPNCAGDIEVVASVPYHNLDTILGIPIWQWTGFRTIRGLTVMRIGERAVNTGCPLIPIVPAILPLAMLPNGVVPGIVVHPGTTRIQFISFRVHLLVQIPLLTQITLPIHSYLTQRISKKICRAHPCK